MTAVDTVPRGTTPVTLDRDVVPPAGATGEILQIPLELIDVDANIRVSVVAIEELAASIAEHGVRQPISVRDVPGYRYAINFGQRRYLASQLAGRTTIPAFVDNEARSPEQLAIHQLVENLAREDLPALDRARAMRTVVDAGMTQAELARQLGFHPSTVANDLRLLETAPEVQAAIADGSLTQAHAKVIAGLDVDLQAEFTKRVIGSNWSSHQTEQNVKYFASEAKRIRENRVSNDRHYAEATELLAKVANAKRSTIGVSESYGGDVKERLKAEGWKVVDGYDVEVVDQAGACGCAGVWRLEIPYYGDAKVALKPGCNDKAHKDARRATQEAEYAKRNKASALARDAEVEARKAKATRLGEYLGAEFADVVQGPLAVRLAIYALLGVVDLEDHVIRTYWDGEDEALYDLDDAAWTLIESVPESDLAKVLGQTVAESLMGGWNGPAAVIAAAIAPLVGEPIETPA